jgi:WhiB family redox-sensing transcriptional regulator
MISKAERLMHELLLATEKIGGADCEKMPDVFFPEDEPNSLSRMRMTNMAKAICGQCMLRKMCAEYAVEAEENFGIWGGLTPTDRRAISRGSKPVFPEAKLLDD